MAAQSAPDPTGSPGPAELPHDTWNVTASKQVSYDITLNPDLLDPADRSLATAGGQDGGGDGPVRRLIVIDSSVYLLHGQRLGAYFAAHGVEHEFCVVEAHESVKSMESVFHVIDAMNKFGVPRRREPVIAVGGGVLTDLVGLAASLYRRSTPYIRVPTTLIGMVDAGIGAKTGVNFRHHKNRLGSYHPSAMTLIDPGFLTTLSPQHIRNGLAEILKIALVKDFGLFELLDAHGPRLVRERMQSAGSEDGGEARTTVLRLAIHGMLEELRPNLWEHQLQRLVDFGHSFSPAIEMAALPELLHGEAVCVDMAFSAVLARRRGLLDGASLTRILRVMRDLGLPVWHPVCTPALMADALAETVDHRDGRQLLPLPEAIGEARFVNDVTRGELDAAVAELRRHSENAGFLATASVSGGA